MTPEEREAVRALIAALPKCSAYTSGFDGDRCGRPATRYDDPWDTGGESEPREHFCDEHEREEDLAEHKYAPALRKLQAILDPEEP